MVKECQVIMNNSSTTVVRHGDVDIQFPSIGRKASTVKVLFKNGKCKIVPDDYKEYQTKQRKTYEKKKEEDSE